MKRLIDRMLQAARQYNLWDYGCLKIALFTLGIIFGAYFSKFFLSFISVIWILFIITYVWIIYKTLIKYWK